MAVGLGKDDHLARQVDISQVAAGEMEGLLLFDQMAELRSFVMLMYCNLFLFN